jgi:hypothetical protein
MERVVPLIPPAVVGPLGVAHLPRMWLKAILNASEMLTEGYFPNYRGFNQKAVDGLGLDPEAFFAYLETMPTYPETERWVRANAKHLSPVAIAQLNIELVTFQRPEEAAAAVRTRVGLNDPYYRSSAALINLDDWFTMHEWLVAHRDDDLEPIIPTVSSGIAGPFGVLHLPRLWMKALLTGVKALPEGWNSGFGFDKRVSDTIGMDLDAACAYIHAELPNYLQFEDWVRANIAPPDEATKAQWNLDFRTREKSAEKSAEERAEVGVPEMTHCDVITLNNMIDWKYLHDRAVARKTAHA